MEAVRPYWPPLSVAQRWGGAHSVEAQTFQFQRNNSRWSASSSSQAGSALTGQGDWETDTSPPSPNGAVASTQATYQIDPTTLAGSQNVVNIGPNPDGQNVLQVNGLLMSQLLVDDESEMLMFASGLMNAPTQNDPNGGTITSTLNTTPPQATGTATAQIQLQWSITSSNPQATASQTGFNVTITGPGGLLLRAFTGPNGLETGTITVRDGNGQRQVNVDPQDGLTLTQTINNVGNGNQFTIRVNPYSETDNIAPGQEATLDVSLSIDARVTVQ